MRDDVLNVLLPTLDTRSGTSPTAASQPRAPRAGWQLERGESGSAPDETGGSASWTVAPLTWLACGAGSRCAQSGASRSSSASVDRSTQ